MQELGVLLSDYQVTQGLDPCLQVDDTGAFRVSDLEFINQADWLVTIPNIIYDFMKTSIRSADSGQPSGQDQRW